MEVEKFQDLQFIIWRLRSINVTVPSEFKGLRTRISAVVNSRPSLSPKAREDTFPSFCLKIISQVLRNLQVIPC